MRTRLLLVLAALSACHKTHPAMGPSVEVQVAMSGGTRAETGSAVDVRLATSGRSRGEMRSAVTAVLERACAKVPHVSRVRGATQDGLSRVTVQFEAGTNLEAALSGIQASMQQAAPMLPPWAGAAQVRPAPGPVVARYSWSSEVLPAVKVDALVQSAIVAPLAQMSGVGRVAMCGGAPEEVRVEIDPRALAATSSTMKDVVIAIQAWRPPSPVQSAELSKLVLGTTNGVPIRLGDVAAISDDGVWRGCLAFDEHGMVEEETVYAHLAADKDAVRKTVDDALRVGVQSLPVGVDHRVLYATREITVDLVPDLAFTALTQLRETVMRVPGVGHFVIEIGDPGDADGVAPTSARILLAPTDDTLVPRLLHALTAVQIVRDSGEANATVELEGADRAALNAASGALFQRLAERDELVARLGVAETVGLSTVVDDEAVHSLGLARDDVDVALSVMRGTAVTSYYVADRSVPVVVGVHGASAATGPFDGVCVRSASGSNVPLSAVVRIMSEGTAPTLLEEGQFPVIGARVHTTDLAGLRHAFEPPAGMMLLVFPD